MSDKNVSDFVFPVARSGKKVGLCRFVPPLGPF